MSDETKMSRENEKEIVERLSERITLQQEIEMGKGKIHYEKLCLRDLNELDDKEIIDNQQNMMRDLNKTKYKMGKGRDNEEVWFDDYKMLWVDRMSKVVDRYKDKLSKGEIDMIWKRYVESEIHYISQDY